MTQASMAVAEAAGQTLDKKFRYHHGDLRQALLAAAFDILSRDGIEGLSLRTLAKATGVTQAAPYSHFGGKDDLLAAIAETGFQRLALQMAEDAQGIPGTRARIEKLMQSYVRFATENRALFRLMFGREIADMKKYPTLAMTAGKSYALFSAALSKVQSTGVDTRFMTVSIWSLCHGLTTLIMEDRLQPKQFGHDNVDAFIRETVSLFSDKLG